MNKWQTLLAVALTGTILHGAPEKIRAYKTGKVTRNRLWCIQITDELGLKEISKASFRQNTDKTRDQLAVDFALGANKVRIFHRPEHCELHKEPDASYTITAREKLPLQELRITSENVEFVDKGQEQLDIQNNERTSERKQKKVTPESKTIAVPVTKLDPKTHHKTWLVQAASEYTSNDKKKVISETSIKKDSSFADDLFILAHQPTYILVYKDGKETGEPSVSIVKSDEGKELILSSNGQAALLDRLP